MNGCCLKLIENLPELPKLIRLELSDNRLTGQNLSMIAQYKTLETVKLGNNLIRNFDFVKNLAKCENLINIDLVSNPVTEVNDFREQMFEIIPTLEVLDGLDKENNEVCSENSAEVEEYD